MCLHVFVGDPGGVQIFGGMDTVIVEIRGARQAIEGIVVIPTFIGDPLAIDSEFHDPGRAPRWLHCHHSGQHPEKGAPPPTPFPFPFHFPSTSLLCPRVPFEFCHTLAQTTKHTNFSNKILIPLASAQFHYPFPRDSRGCLSWVGLPLIFVHFRLTSADQASPVG